MRDLSSEGPVTGQLTMLATPPENERKKDTMTTITRTLEGLHALRTTRDLLITREAQRADALAREMAEAETTLRYAEADELRATINEDRSEDLNALLDLLSPCPECGAEMGQLCDASCEERAHEAAPALTVLDLG